MEWDVILWFLLTNDKSRWSTEPLLPLKTAYMVFPFNGLSVVGCIVQNLVKQSNQSNLVSLFSRPKAHIPKFDAKFTK